MDNSKYHILGSETFNYDMPEEENVWKYIYPFFKKWSEMNLQYYVNGETGATVSYKRMLGMSLCWSKELKKHFKGSSPPSVLAVLPNSPEFLAAILGCLAIGAPFCLGRFDVSVEYVRNVLLKASKPSVIIVDSKLSLSTVIKALEEFNLGFTPTIYVRGTPVPSKFNSFDKILCSNDELGIETAGQFDSAATSLIVFSSGTTGVPKSIPISSKNLVMAAHRLCYKHCCSYTSTTCTKTEVFFANVSMSHAFGVWQFCILGPKFGYQVVDYEETNPVKVYEAIQIFKPSLFVGRPFIWNYFSKWEECTHEGLKSIRVVVNAGCPPSTEAIYALKKKTNNQLILQDNYGMTESGPVAVTPLNQKKLEMSGIILPGIKIRFVDPKTGEDVTKPFQRGEVFIISHALMTGYLDNPEANEESFTSDGWFRTGDVGYFDEDNFIKIDDRIKDIITVGNTKVFPTAIENLILKHSSVKEVGVVGAPGSNGTEVPRAFIVKRGPLKAGEIEDYVEKNGPPEMRLLGGIEFTDDIPRNPLGKVLRKFLRRGVWEVGANVTV